MEDEQAPHEGEETEPAFSRSNIFITVLAVSIILNLYLAFEYQVSRRYPWGSKLKDTAGRVIMISYYEPLSFHPHKSIALRKDGAKLVEWTDKEMDGWFEESRVFGKHAILAWEDRDEDGVSQVGWLRTLDGQLIGKFIDLDEDGLIDRYQCRDGAVKRQFDYNACETTTISAAGW